MKAKARFINEKKLAGAMFWEYYSDPEGELLNALHKKLNN